MGLSLESNNLCYTVCFHGILNLCNNNYYSNCSFFIINNIYSHVSFLLVTYFVTILPENLNIA